MNDLQGVMAEAGFHLTETGGGCTAYIRVDGIGYTLITRAEDAEAPESLEDACTVGRETAEGEYELVGHADDVRVALALARRER